MESPDLELDYVYMGQRFINNNKRCLALGVIKDGRILENFHLPFKRQNVKVVGSVYSGATFSADLTTISGHSSAKYKERWANPYDIVLWEAAQNEALIQIATVKLEKDTGKKAEVEKIMEPLQKLYQERKKARDYAGCRALERLVVDTLIKP